MYVATNPLTTDSHL